MKKLTIFLASFFISQECFAIHTILRNAGNITQGTLQNERLDNSSVTKLGPTIDAGEYTIGTGVIFTSNTGTGEFLWDRRGVVGTSHTITGSLLYNSVGVVFASNTAAGISGGLVGNGIGVIFASMTARGIVSGIVENGADVITSTMTDSSIIDTSASDQAKSGTFRPTTLRSNTITPDPTSGDMTIGVAQNASVRIGNTGIGSFSAGGAIGIGGQIDNPEAEYAISIGSNILSSADHSIAIGNGENTTRPLQANSSGTIIFAVNRSSPIIVISSDAFNLDTGSITLRQQTYIFPTTAPANQTILRHTSGGRLIWGGDAEGAGGGGAGVDGSTVGIRPFRITIGTSPQQNVQMVGETDEVFELAIASMAGAIRGGAGGIIAVREGIYTFDETVHVPTATHIILSRDTWIEMSGSTNLIKIFGTVEGGNFRVLTVSTHNIILEDNGILRNTRITGRTGGAEASLTIRGENALLESCLIDNNTLALNSIGKFIYINEGAKNASIKKTSVVNNNFNHAGNGLGIRVRSTDTVILSENFFANNINGGAMFQLEKSSHSLFVNNIFDNPSSIDADIRLVPQGGIDDNIGNLITNNLFVQTVGVSNIRIESGGTDSQNQNNVIANNIFTMRDTGGVKTAITLTGVSNSTFDTFIHGNTVVSTGTFVTVATGAEVPVRRDNVVGGRLEPDD